MRINWLDVVLYLLAAVLLIPLVVRFANGVMKAMGP